MHHPRQRRWLFGSDRKGDGVCVVRRDDANCDHLIRDQLLPDPSLSDAEVSFRAQVGSSKPHSRSARRRDKGKAQIPFFGKVIVQENGEALEVQISNHGACQEPVQKPQESHAAEQNNEQPWQSPGQNAQKESKRDEHQGHQKPERREYHQRYLVQWSNDLAIPLRCREAVLQRHRKLRAKIGLDAEPTVKGGLPLLQYRVHKDAVLHIRLLLHHRDAPLQPRKGPKERWYAVYPRSNEVLRGHTTRLPL
mmetsp:Transcript_4037/g.11725  ORF Transcript_4037/g.11725 Transcript_4037/m.11725 type:complete len:250 (-) Transcript_4037:1898-2647(-)